MSEPRLLFARPDGTLLEHPALRAGGMTFDRLVPQSVWRPLPAGATLVQLPGCTAVGFDARGRTRPLRPGRELAVGALLPTGFARLLLPAYQKQGPQTAALPLFGYTAVAMLNGALHAAYTPIDAPGTWDPADYHTADLAERVAARRAADPENPLVAQLARCAVEYGCFTAQNIFFERWEGALPASPACSAQCVGCISEQLGSVPSPQERLTFAPTPQALADLAVRHLGGGPHRMISFGQGCEGDPLNRWRQVAQAIELIRERLPTGHPCAGVINMNTNAWHTRGLQRCIEAGLQRIRVSVFSAIDAHYAAYYQPRGYSFADVRNSIRLCAQAGVHVALNLLTFPGYTDAEGEIDAFRQLIEEDGVHEVQVRTLNIDREVLRAAVPPPTGVERGVECLIAVLGASGVRIASHAWIDATAAPERPQAVR
jgi:hypothetical protein